MKKLILHVSDRCSRVPERPPGQRPAPPCQEKERVTRPVASRAVTPGSLADQYNREAEGRDPMSFFYPYGYFY
jgi:hypothetical protein